MFRKDIPEGWYFPLSAIAWGRIVPLSPRAPTRRYFILRLPCFKHSAEPEIWNDAIVARWRQLTFLFTDTMWDKPRIKHDGWHFIWLDTEDEPTEVITAIQMMEKRNG